MVVKTEICNFSGFRIYPGHGCKYIRMDGKQYTFINQKCERYFHMRRKAAKLNWTQLYRRLHKKGVTVEASKKRTKRTKTQVPKAVVGASLEVIKAKRAQKSKTQVKTGGKSQMLKELKEREKAKKTKKAAPAKK